MFDPTIYENIKVVIEGAIYDLDLQGEILITDRKDLVDLSSMSRTYKIRFELIENSKDSKSANEDNPATEIVLHAELSDLASEILEIKETKEIGCWLEVLFFANIKKIEQDGKQIHKTMREIWGPELSVLQTISYPLSFLKNGEVDMKASNHYEHVTRILFNRKINEEQLVDMENLLAHVLRSLRKLDHMLQS